jgi:hypothetical protein
MIWLLATAAHATEPEWLREPYLQKVSHEAASVLWATAAPGAGRVWYGPAGGALDQVVEGGDSATLHQVRIRGLEPGRSYDYRVEVDGVAAPGEGYTFTTAPEPGDRGAWRAWVVGDSGTGSDGQHAVRDAFLRANGGPHTDLYLHVGDIAYNSALEDELTEYVFTIYPEILRTTPIWPTYGNHDGYGSDSEAQEGPWFDAFDTPDGGELGGVRSEREDWYSFNYGSTHFISLNSYDADRLLSGEMRRWLQADLAVAAEDGAEWIVAYWHHPPYSKGTHDSDTERELVEMRESIVPVLEAGGVDLVLSGHSHTYERSFLLDGAYETPSTELGAVVRSHGDPWLGEAYWKPAGLTAHGGALYVVSGHGGASVGQRGEHPLMYRTEVKYGSLLVDARAGRLTVKNLRGDGAITDRVALVKGEGLLVVRPEGGELYQPGETAEIRWLSSGFDAVALSWSLDGGETWSDIDEVEDSGAYRWTLPEVGEAASVLVRVASADGAVEDAVDDVSSAPLTLGGEVLDFADAGSSWRYYDGESEPKDDWFTASYDDSDWEQGQGPFGFGDARTRLETGRVSYYLRRTVDLDRQVLGARLEALVDDGVTLWLNGEQLTAWNVEDQDHDDYAAAEARDGETLVQFVAPERFVAGPNVLAVQLKQHPDDMDELLLELSLRLVPGGEWALADALEEGRDTGPVGDTDPKEPDADPDVDDVADEDPAEVRPEAACSCGGGGVGGWGLAVLLVVWRRRRGALV